MTKFSEDLTVPKYSAVQWTDAQADLLFKVEFASDMDSATDYEEGNDHACQRHDRAKEFKDQAYQNSQDKKSREKRRSRRRSFMLKREKTESISSDSDAEAEASNATEKQFDEYRNRYSLLAKNFRDDQ